MTVIYSTGNIFDLNVDALVNPVNCVGVMGKGLAEEFKIRYPGNFRTYQSACIVGGVRVGKIFVYPTGLTEGVKFIFNFPTKQHWRNPSRLKWIEDGLLDLLEVIMATDTKTIGIPALGCGEGGLSWNDVQPRIQFALDALPGLRAVVFPPQVKT